MGDCTGSEYKLLLTAQASATMGTDPRWDSAVSEFLRTFALWQADEHYGAYAKADEAWSIAKFDLEHRFGAHWERAPAAQAGVESHKAALRAAEDTHHTRFVAPYWKALRDLAMTPAPTVTAACLKQSLMQIEEIWNDSLMTASCFDLLEADFARLANPSESDRWAQALALYNSTLAAENAYEAEVWDPAYQAASAEQETTGADGYNIPRELNAELERLQDVRIAAEDAMVATPAPDLAALIAKIEASRKRWDGFEWTETQWAPIIADLTRLAGVL